MERVELTWKRVLAVWWLTAWRSALGGYALALATGFVVGFVLAIAGHPVAAKPVILVFDGIVWLIWGIVVVRMALQKLYADFRLQPVALRTSQNEELAWRHVLAVWWLLAWRGTLGGCALGFASSFVLTIVLTIAGHYAAAERIAPILGGLLGLIWSIVVTRMALQKMYEDFLLQPVAPGRSLRSAGGRGSALPASSAAGSPPQGRDSTP